MHLKVYTKIVMNGLLPHDINFQLANKLSGSNKIIFKKQKKQKKKKKQVQ